MAAGCYVIWTADAEDKVLGYSAGVLPDLYDPQATKINFGLLDNTPRPVPSEQSELQQEIEKVLRAVRQIYHRQDAGEEERNKAQFRSYYVRLFRLAQVGLEGNNVSPDIAKNALAVLVAELVDDEAGRIKNGHMKALGWMALKIGIVPVLIYLWMRCISPKGSTATFLHSIGIDPLTYSNFMLLWVGCFIGVWLSYGIRTTTFTLTDLTITDSDRMLPAIRLLFAGTLTAILGIIFSLGLVKISIGEIPLTNISQHAEIAFLIGALCGISELLLPTAVSKQANEFIGKIK